MSIHMTTFQQKQFYILTNSVNIFTDNPKVSQTELGLLSIE